MLTITDVKTVVNSKLPKRYMLFAFFLIVVVLVLILIAIFYKYNLYFNYVGYIGKEEEYYVAIYLEDTAILDFKNADLMIEGEPFKYEKMEISDEYYMYGNKEAKLIKLYGKIEEKELIVNNVLAIKAKGEETTLFNEIKKGLNL